MKAPIPRGFLSSRSSGRDRDGVTAPRTAAVIVSAALATCMASTAFAASRPKPIVYAGSLRFEQDRHGNYRESTAIGNDNPLGVAVDSSGNLYVANAGTNTVTVYAPTGNGYALNAEIGGPDTELVQPLAVTLDRKGKIYVLSGRSIAGPSNNGAVLVYRAGSRGDAVPVATISGDATGLTSLRAPSGIAVDAAGNIYVSNPGGNQTGSIMVYGPSANGNVKPRAVLNGYAGLFIQGFVYPTAIALDKEDKLYVASLDFGTYPGVFVYAPGANGNATPIASITSPTALGGRFSIINGISVDAAGRIYVAGSFRATGDLPGVAIFAAGSTGNVAPSVTISGSSTQLSEPAGMAVDQTGKIYVAQGRANNVEVYSPGSNGNAAPVATITRGEASVGGAITVDTAGNVYACGNGGGYGQRISVFAPGTTDAPPIRTVGELATSSSIACAIDRQGNIYVLRDQSVSEYAAGSGSDAPPIATIAGPNTGLEGGANGILGIGLAVDRHRNVYVGIQGPGPSVSVGSILVFPSGSNGNVAPSARISGPHTGLSAGGLVGIALDSADNIYATTGFSLSGGNLYLGNAYVFAPGSDGDARPSTVIDLRSIPGFVTPGISLDSLGNLYFSAAIGANGQGALGILSGRGNALPRFVRDPVFGFGFGSLAVFPPAKP